MRPLKWSSKYEAWNSTDASKKSSKDLNRSERDLTNNVDASENDLSQTSRKLGYIGNLSLLERGHLPESTYPNDTTESVSIEDDFNLDSDKLLGPLPFSRPSIDEFFFDTISQNQAQDTAGLWDDLLIPPPQVAEDQSTRLSRYYFSSICRINCCFDSSKNPFRVWVAELMHSCPPLYHCILSMSASHLVAKQQKDLLPIALEHRAKAVSKLSTEMLSVDVNSGLKSYPSFEVISRALLVCILLGMTDVRSPIGRAKMALSLTHDQSWHNPSVLGITHLHGARVLYKRWLIGANDSFDTPAGQPKLSHVKSFLVGAMAYWEAIASFLVDQPVQSISYLMPTCDQTGTGKIQSNPWTGISTPVFVYLAQAGALGRQRSIIRKLAVSNSNTGIHETLLEQLLVQARGVEDALLSYQVPSIDRIEDTGDALTPVSHLQKMAQVYKLTALLEIYRVFPELLQKPSSDEVDVFQSTSFRSRILAMAIGILTTISTIPETSGVNVLLCPPMITSGSALQSTGPNQPEFSQGSAQGSLCSELISIFIQNDAHTRWREFVRERMNIIHNCVGLGSVTRALDVIEKTWFRADVQVFANEPDSVGEFVHWTDVMADERLETIFG